MKPKSDRFVIIPSPGEILANILTEREVSPANLAKLIPCSEITILAIIYLQHPITLTMAKKLERALNIPIAFWLSKEQAYQDYLKYLQSRLDELG